MKLALLAVQLETQFNELVRVARILRNSESYKVLFCFYDLTPLRFTRMRAVCAQERFDFILFDQSEDELSGKQNDSSTDVIIPGNNNVPVRRLWFWLREVAPFLVSLRNLVRRFQDFVKCLKSVLARGRRQIAQARKLIENRKPAIFIIGEDGLGGPAAIIKVARAHRIPVVVVPYEYSTMTQPAVGIVSVSGYRSLYGMDSWINRIVARLFPQWVYEYKGERLLRELNFFILAQELLGIAPRLPWVVHGGQADCIAVENKAMFQHYLKQGIPAKKLILTGALYDDILALNIKTESELTQNVHRQTHKRTENKRSILCALPPDHIIGRPNCDFRTYWELVDFWIESLVTLENVKVVFQLHPRVTEEQAQYIKAKQVNLLRDDIASLIPHCDILVTSVSSIIRLAIACKKVVVNYDVYKFGYQDFADAGGVITFQARDEFAAILHRLVSDDFFFADMVARQSSCAEDWGFLDGHVADRMLQLFNQLTDE